MKKFLPFLSLLGLFLPFFQVAKANEYQFLTATTSGNTVTFYGVTSNGTSTTLNSYSGSDVGIHADIEDGIYDEYNGKVYFSTYEQNAGDTTSAEYLLEYDLKNNSITKLSSAPTQDMILYPKGINQMIKKDSSTGVTSIGENSLKVKETAHEQQLWGTNAQGKIVPINITNGSKLLINGRDVEQSINNVGALSAALTGLPTVPTETTLACGLGTGTHGGDFAFSGGCATKVNEKLSINYAASMTMPGQDYAGDFEDSFSARAGFVWQLSKAIKPTQISMREGKELKEEIIALKENNQNIISQNKALLARLEKLEKIALIENMSKDLAIYKLK